MVPIYSGWFTRPKPFFLLLLFLGSYNLLNIFGTNVRVKSQKAQPQVYFKAKKKIITKYNTWLTLNYRYGNIYKTCLKGIDVIFTWITTVDKRHSFQPYFEADCQPIAGWLKSGKQISINYGFG